MNDSAAAARPGRRRRSAGTRAILERFVQGDPADTMRMGELLGGLGRRAFGVLLLVAIPTAFIPGIAGVVSSPIIILVGLQLLAGRRRPWLPRFLAERGPQRSTLIRFQQRLSPWLNRLERVVRPRMLHLLDRRFASLLTGLLLVLLGVLLALPIPFTNAIFAGVLLIYALALLERDGGLMLVAWALGVATVATVGLLSGSLASLITPWIDLLI